MTFRQKRGVGVSLALHPSRNGMHDVVVREAAPRHALVMLAGEPDTSNVAQLYEVLADLTRGGVRHIGINLAELEFVDSTGLSALVAAHMRAEALGGEMTLFSPNQDMRRLFELTGINAYFNIRPRRGGSAPRT
jgi:anti-sigma B factor antagonist